MGTSSQIWKPPVVDYRFTNATGNPVIVEYTCPRCQGIRITHATVLPCEICNDTGKVRKLIK